MICQNGPMVLGGVPAVGLVLARIRQALGRDEDQYPAPATDAPKERA